MLDTLLYLAVGAVIWLVCYCGFFGLLDWLIRRNIEDPSIPRYVGLTRKRR